MCKHTAWCIQASWIWLGVLVWLTEWFLNLTYSATYDLDPLTIDEYFNHSTICSKVVFKLQPVGSFVLLLCILNVQERMPVSHLHFVFASLDFLAISDPLYSGFGVACEWNLQDNVLALLKGSGLLETLGYIDLGWTCGNRRPVVSSTWGLAMFGYSTFLFSPCFCYFSLLTSWHTFNSEICSASSAATTICGTTAVLICIFTKRHRGSLRHVCLHLCTSHISCPPEAVWCPCTCQALKIMQNVNFQHWKPGWLAFRWFTHSNATDLGVQGLPADFRWGLPIHCDFKLGSLSLHCLSWLHSWQEFRCFGSWNTKRVHTWSAAIILTMHELFGSLWS